MTVDADRFGRVPDDAFDAFVADLWRRAGWRVRPRGTGAHGYTADAPDRGGLEAVLRPLPPSEGWTDADRVRGVVADAADPSLVTAVSGVGFTAGALDVADAHGVDAVGPDALARLVDALDAGDLLADA